MSKVEKQAEFSDEEINDLIDTFLAIEGPDEKLFERLYKFIRLLQTHGSRPGKHSR